MISIIRGTDNPTTVILTAKNVNPTNYTQQTQIYPMTFIVPPNYYYKVLKASSNGTVTLTSWFEAEI